MAYSMLLPVSILLLLSAPAVANNSGSFLGSSRSLKLTSEKRLRERITDLASALHDHLNARKADAADSGIDSASAARALLLQEASQPREWDGADLLRNYAAWAPNYMLMVPMSAPLGHNTIPHLNPALPIHSVSQESVTQSDGHHLVSQTTSCKDGKCKTTAASKAAGDDKAGGTALDDNTDFNGLGSLESTKSSLNGAMQQMAQEMHHWDQTFGRDPLKQTLGSIFDEARDGFPSSDKDQRFGPMASFGHMPMKDMFKTAQAKSSQSQSVSSETRVENGKRVTHQKMCKNGHCKTVVTSEDLDEKPSGADQPPNTQQTQDDFIW